MKLDVSNVRSKIVTSGLRSAGISTWAVVTVLILLLVATGVLGYIGWTSSEADVPTSGYVAMALGVIFSLAVGVGLMALVFYSSRKGYDEPAVLIQEPDGDQDQKTDLPDKQARQNDAL